FFVLAIGDALSAVSSPVVSAFRRTCSARHETDALRGSPDSVEGRTQSGVTHPVNDARRCCMTVCHSLATLVSRSDARRHATRLVVAASATLVLMLPSPAHAQTASVCGPEVKAEVAKALSAVAG